MIKDTQQSRRVLEGRQPRMSVKIRAASQLPQKTQKSYNNFGYFSPKRAHNSIKRLLIALICIASYGIRLDLILGAQATDIIPN